MWGYALIIIGVTLLVGLIVGEAFQLAARLAAMLFVGMPS